MDRSAWERVLGYIETHIREKIRLSDLADEAGYTPFYFSRLFSAYMGMPVTGYIRIRKLQHAAVSLLEGNKVLDVALLYAFDSHEGFTRAFTRLFGSTPSTVRRHLSSYTVPPYPLPTHTNRRNRMETTHPTDQRQTRHELVFEVLEESLKEAKAGFCTRISVTVLPGGRIEIRDNGRGLPLSRDACASQAVLDKILAGQPVTNVEYSQLGDLTQAGLQAVNSLCEFLRVTVYRDGRVFRQEYIRGVAQQDLRIGDTDGERGTEILLKPDTALFGEEPFSTAVIREWLSARTHGMNALSVRVQEKSAEG